MFDPDSNKKKAVADSTTGVFVSLYLIVLAFFIVMNVISNQVKSKVSASVSSVSTTFKAKYIREADKLELPSDRRSSTPNRDFQRSVEDALQFSELEIDNRHISRGGSQLRVDIRVDDIFMPTTAVLNDESSDVLIKLVALINNADASEMREFAFFFGYGTNASAEEGQAKRTLAMQRAGALARHLLAINAPTGSFTTGFRSTDETRVTAVFRTSELKNFPIILEPMEGIS